MVSTSCSLLHTAVDLANETKLDKELKSWLAFAAQKVVEVNALAKALGGQKDEVFLFMYFIYLQRDRIPVNGNTRGGED